MERQSTKCDTCESDEGITFSGHHYTDDHVRVDVRAIVKLTVGEPMQIYMHWTVTACSGVTRTGVAHSVESRESGAAYCDVATDAKATFERIASESADRCVASVRRGMETVR